ncbi:phospholipase A2 [Streptomyces lavendulocolor]|uniref:phospholipase A2 n=1 Tax=Streptomyces lavendulocolor TaxID=67316 RepID=UPI003C30AFA3
MRRKLPTAVAALAFVTTTALSGVVATAGTAAADIDPVPVTELGATSVLLPMPVPVPVPVSVPGAGTAPAADPGVRREADRIMHLTYREFARTPRVQPFDWTTDGCSVPVGYAPYSQVFRPACVQHDFGYRNYGARGALSLSPTRETKNWIDSRFRTEMERVCQDTYATPLAGLNCMNAARAYHVAVSLGGDGAFF